MVQRSRFSPSMPTAPAGRKLSQNPVFDMRGLNSTDPYDVLEKYASPYLRNARMYDSEEDRQTAISTRKGPGFYSIPIGETEDDTEESVTGAADQTVGTVAWKAQKFTASTAGRLTKLEIRLKNTSTSQGHIIVSVHDDDGGEPGTTLAVTSSVLSSAITSSYAYEEMRFIEAPLLASATDYWIVAKIQDGGSGEYNWSSTTNSTDALASNTSGNSWTAQSYSLNFKVSLSTDGGVKGIVRHERLSADNTTLFMHKQDIYEVTDSTGATASIKSSLNTNATRYRFTQYNGKTYIANGYDSLMEYDGTSISDNALTYTPSIVVAHKERIYALDADNPTIVRISGSLGDDQTWESTNFWGFAPAGTATEITALISFQDSLVAFFRDDKQILYGSNLGNYTQKQALGIKGAVSQEAVVVDENYVYFVSNDGIYRWNGSKDEKISIPIQADLDDIADVSDVYAYMYEGRVYFCFQSTGGVDYDSKFVWDTDYNEWLYDTGTHVKGGLELGDDDDETIVEFSDKVGALYYGDQSYSQLGKPINFEYWTKYFNFGYSDNDKQIRRYYLHLRSQSQPFNLTVGVDKDFNNSPVTTEVALQGVGDKWGSFVWGTGEWGQTQYKHPKINIPGRAVYFQLRLSKNGVDTPIDFIGHNAHYRLRRPR